MQCIYALVLLPRWYRTNGHKNKYGSQNAHMEVLKPHAGTEKVNHHLFSGALFSFAGEGEYIDICASEAIKPFSKRFWHLQEPRKWGIGIACPQ